MNKLSHLNDRQLTEIFLQRRDDPQFLNALNELLKQRDSDAAIDLHVEVAKARRTLVRTAAPSKPPPEPLHSGPVRDWLRDFLGARNIKQPNGQALYRYRMADGEYADAKSTLRRLAHAGRLAEPDRRAGALFVAYCAEWFRRESDTTFLRWDSLDPRLFPSVPYASKQALTQFGLDYWRRPLRKRANAREFLLTVAMEGGFPVRILAEGARGWLKEYLRAIIRRAIAWQVDTLDEIHTIAEDERGRMRKRYQHDDFVALCAELATNLLRLRRTAEAEGTGGLRNTALLDARHHGWRDELPIYVPAHDEALVAELLTGLIDEKMTGLTTQGVEARRYLVKKNGEWHPALQLLADGEIPPAKLPSLTALSRVRAIATGELSNHIAGELALFEPPFGEQRRWRVRPYKRSAELLLNFPFLGPVTATLRSPDDVSHPWTWPRGEALRSDVLVFEHDEGSTPQQPLLRFLRSGSVSSSAKSLSVLVPHDWMVEPTPDGAILGIEELPALRCKLVHLTAAAYFRASEHNAIRFRVEPDSNGRECELELLPLPGAGFTPANDIWELVAAPANPLIREPRRQPRSPTPGELFIRRPGGPWTPLSSPLNDNGVVELSWRDPVANIQIEKRRLVLVPEDARIEGILTDAQSGEIRLRGLPGWTATVRETSCTVDVVDSSVLSIRFAGRPVYRLPMTLRPPVGQSFDVIVPLVGQDAVVALADGSILTPGRQVDVRALRGAIAVAPRRTILHLTPKGSKSGGLRTVVDGELPLGVLRSAIDETLATLPQQDDLVELDFVGDTRPPIRVSRYRHDQLAHDRGTIRWLASASSSAAPVARMILDPRHEHALEPAEDCSWRFPDRCMGPCLAYLRDGVDVVSRPLSLVRAGSPDSYAGALASAMTVVDFEARQNQILEALTQLGRGCGETDDLAWLRDAAINLNGLPASAFDALKLLPSSPETLIRLLFRARDTGERSVLWSLQHELPFLWLALPVRAWIAALRHESMIFVKAVETALGEERAIEEAVGWLRAACNDLATLEPALTTVFSMAGIHTHQENDVSSLRELTSGYIRDQHHRGGDARNELAARLASVGLTLPSEIESKSHADFAGLIAPALLAASAQEKITLEHDENILARRILREDPIFVSNSWKHLVKFYGSN